MLLPSIAARTRVGVGENDGAPAKATAMVALLLAPHISLDIYTSLPLLKEIGLIASAGHLSVFCSILDI
jgi:hypothetical protein